MELEERYSSIKTRQDLADFVNALAADLREHTDGWENPTLEQYLESLAAYIDSLDRVYSNMGGQFSEQQPWALIAQILVAPKSYE